MSMLGSKCCCKKKCGTTTNSGGAGITIDDYDMPEYAGDVEFSYNAYRIPDNFTVYNTDDPNEIYFDTGGRVSGAATISFFKPVGVTSVSVRVEGPSGTGWRYTIGCPEAPCNSLSISPSRVTVELEADEYEMTIPVWGYEYGYREVIRTYANGTQVAQKIPVKAWFGQQYYKGNWLPDYIGNGIYVFEDAEFVSPWDIQNHVQADATDKDYINFANKYIDTVTFVKQGSVNFSPSLSFGKGLSGTYELIRNTDTTLPNKLFFYRNEDLPFCNFTDSTPYQSCDSFLSIDKVSYDQGYSYSCVLSARPVFHIKYLSDGDNACMNTVINSEEYSVNQAVAGVSAFTREPEPSAGISLNISLTLQDSTVNQDINHGIYPYLRLFKQGLTEFPVGCYDEATNYGYLGMFGAKLQNTIFGGRQTIATIVMERVSVSSDIFLARREGFNLTDPTHVYVSNGCFVPALANDTGWPHGMPLGYFFWEQFGYPPSMEDYENHFYANIQETFPSRTRLPGIRIKKVNMT